MSKNKNEEIIKEDIIKNIMQQKRLNNKIIDDSDKIIDDSDNDNKIIDDSDNGNKIIDDSDNDNKIIDDSDNENDFYYISIIIKFLNVC